MVGNLLLCSLGETLRNNYLHAIHHSNRYVPCCHEFFLPTRPAASAGSSCRGMLSSWPFIGRCRSPSFKRCKAAIGSCSSMHFAVISSLVVGITGFPHHASCYQDIENVSHMTLPSGDSQFTKSAHYLLLLYAVHLSCIGYICFIQ